MPAPLKRAQYWDSIANFLAEDPNSILGRIAGGNIYDANQPQLQAWKQEIELLKGVLHDREGWIGFEFDVPRMGHRADVVLLTSGTVVVVEFKFEAAGKINRAAVNQVWDYALELKHFHAASHDLPIVPILVVPEANDLPAEWSRRETAPDLVYRPIAANQQSLQAVLEAAITSGTTNIDADAWYGAPYHPSPSIIKAAEDLWAGHSVAEIASSGAGTEELRAAAECLRELAQKARDLRQRLICFLTGVPGAGKTLIGLGMAAQRTADGDPHAVFLSGNEPLVRVLRAALVRDKRKRRGLMRETGARTETTTAVKKFIQNVHEHRNEALRNEQSAPFEHIAIFDEAQRAWTRKRLAEWLKQRIGVSNFDRSEPEVLIGTLARKPDWSMIVCLVGEGQEINRGEAGIGEWFRAVADRFPDWSVYASPGFADLGQAAEAWRGIPSRTEEPRLHLSVSRRSLRAENLSHFVQSLLDCDRLGAREHLERFHELYPVRLTRDLEQGKQWVRDHARGSERFGLLATSKAVRLKPYAVDVRIEVDPVHWFLDGREDLRSSFALEDAATEFDVQGLEIDWACIAWDGDVRHTGSGWTYHKVQHNLQNGSRWVNIGERNTWGRIYALNAYRVLLTRARQGMVICVPQGQAADPTRKPEFYDRTYEYLAGLGISSI